MPVLFARVISVGVATAASSVFDLNPGCSCLDDASDIAFAAPVSAAEAEPNAVSLLARGKTSCVSGDGPGGTEGAGAV
jgi:hypothetical protein